ncbi:hypothetical protein HQ529_00760 [Candidatus Woesearchaeota archaeon]|nr:hypothetical protein [Candidatus Woesearchaeota archaeon]
MDLKSKKELVKQLIEILDILSFEEKQEIFSEVLHVKTIKLPISIFKAELSGLEIITKYLKEVERKSFKEIEKLLNRKPSTVYNTYRNSKAKFKQELDLSDNFITIPVDIFLNRKYSVLENIVAYLKEERTLSLVKISQLLNKNYNTIKTVYRKYKIKNDE